MANQKRRSVAGARVARPSRLPNNEADNSVSTDLGTSAEPALSDESARVASPAPDVVSDMPDGVSAAPNMSNMSDMSDMQTSVVPSQTYAAAEVSAPPGTRRSSTNSAGNTGNARNAGNASSAGNTGNAGTASAARSTGKKSHSFRVVRIILYILFIVVIVLAVAIVGGFSYYRWLYGNDAADIQGTWYVAGTNTPIVITQDELELTDTTAYAYVVDPESKTITYSLGTYEGSGCYRFSLDRDELAIVDGSFNWLDTLVSDIVWLPGALIAFIQGESEPLVNEDTADVTLLSRTPASGDVFIVEDFPATSNDFYGEGA